MNKNGCWLRGLVISIAVTLIASCGSGGGNGVDTSMCPDWALGDSMTFQRTVDQNGVRSISTTTYTVTERTRESVTLSDGSTTKVYSIFAGCYFPKSEKVADRPAEGFYGTSTTYLSTTPFCPPPVVGQMYEYETWVPDPLAPAQAGDLVTTNLTVTGVYDDDLVLPAGEYATRKVVMEKTEHWPLTTEIGRVTRYYSDGIGVVKEVTEMPSASTIATDELVAYSWADAAGK